MKMCVHATIAATTLLIETGRCTNDPARITTALGTLDIAWDGTRAVLAQFPAVFGEPVLGAARRRVLHALNVDDSAGEIVSVSTARAKLIVALADEVTLDALEPDFELVWEICDELGVTGFYPFARLDEPGATADVAARQFPRRTGYEEDPATGVAACALGAYLSAQSTGPQGWQSWTIAQGRAMGHRSLITAEARSDESGAIAATRVSGQARRLGPGESRSI
jgi:trans-2,3-dihydro-3-hydroxyanthranilate isomerase